MHTDEDIIETMDIFGGSFIKALAELWRRGDNTNKEIIRVAFRGYWKHYDELTTLRKERDAAQRRKLEDTAPHNAHLRTRSTTHGEE